MRAQIPRFAFEKFPGSKAELSTQMKSVGEAMAIGRTFQASLPVPRPCQSPLQARALLLCCVTAQVHAAESLGSRGYVSMSRQVEVQRDCVLQQAQYKVYVLTSGRSQP